MTVSSTSRIATFLGSGSTGPFPFTFGYYEHSDIIVIRNTAGVNTALTEGTDYTIVDGPVQASQSYAGGNVTLAAVLQSGETLTIQRLLPYTQLTAFTNLGAFFSELHEAAFDRLTMEVQQLAELVSTVPVTATYSGSSTAYISCDSSSIPVTVDIAGLTDVIITKIDNSTNAVTISDSTGKTIERAAQYRDGLLALDETVHLVLFGNNWAKVS